MAKYRRGCGVAKTYPLPDRSVLDNSQQSSDPPPAFAAELPRKN